MCRRFSEGALAIVVAILLLGCQSTPKDSVPDGAASDRSAAGASVPSRPAIDREQAPAPTAVGIVGSNTPVEIDKKSQALFDNALAASQAGRLQDAEVLFSELTAREPALAGPWVNLGIVQRQLGDDAAAEASFRKALEADPDSCAAYNELGVLRRRAGDFAAAEANYLACVQRVPDFREAHLNLGILYELYLGRLPEAIDAYRAYLALSGEDHRVAGWVSDLERRVSQVSQR